MGELSFIHLSDIHFVKNSNNPADIDSDLRNAIFLDIKNNAKRNLQNIKGVLVSGDIAFSGNEQEYLKAEEFLEKITSELNIQKSSIFCVPGNHDVDQRIPKGSKFVYNAQNELDKAQNLDEADKLFQYYLEDPYYNEILFKTIEQYNEFAKKCSCAVGPNMINWNYEFELDNDLVLDLYGMNSCFISNSDDHKVPNDYRKMYIGQAQIPSRKDNNICMGLCHHPPEYWKFQDKIDERINKRIDIQLYGHKHVQSMKLTDRNIILSSGAAHPVRGDDWNPRYNWITIECVLIDEERVVKVKIYSRILSKDRDGFIAEQNEDNIYIEHYLNIDKKRRTDTFDKRYDKIPKSIHNYKVNNRNKNEIYDRIYEFYDLSYIDQTEILLKLNLLDDTDRGAYNIQQVIERAKNIDVLDKLWINIEKRYKEKNYAS
ncbi:metallophosphoesterase [Vallitalea guaymasensis]|uniref:metallophosphoesterase n=1 Tax=Vallitalea guaymasensis TaxID=1185412 RepID=UPI00187D24CF|nr:metallophosphoesterase [Vallitalea guaymasensis]